MVGGLSKEETDRLDDFLGGPWIAVMATIGRDGVPLLAPVWYSYSDGRIAISSRKETVKSRNLARDSRIALTVCSEPQARDYVTIWGAADVMEGDSIWPATREILERYMEPDRVEAYLAQLKTENRTIISVRPQRVRFRT
jgi:PPOX class probable F420-dependent enzyme